MSIKLSEKQAECLQIIESLPFVDFSTISEDGFPSTRLMMNLRHRTHFPAQALYNEEKQPLTVYLTAHSASGKMAELQKNPKASLYFCDPSAFRSVLLAGIVEIVTDNGLRTKVWQREWAQHYPNPEKDYTLLRFVPCALKICVGHILRTERF